MDARDNGPQRVVARSSRARVPKTADRETESAITACHEPSIRLATGNVTAPPGRRRGVTADYGLFQASEQGLFAAAAPPDYEEAASR